MDHRADPTIQINGVFLGTDATEYAGGVCNSLQHTPELSAHRSLVTRGNIEEDTGQLCKNSIVEQRNHDCVAPKSKFDNFHLQLSSTDF